MRNEIYRDDNINFPFENYKLLFFKSKADSGDDCFFITIKPN